MNFWINKGIGLAFAYEMLILKYERQAKSREWSLSDIWVPSTGTMIVDGIRNPIVGHCVGCLYSHPNSNQ